MRGSNYEAFLQKKSLVTVRNIFTDTNFLFCLKLFFNRERRTSLRKVEKIEAKIKKVENIGAKIKKVEKIGAKIIQRISPCQPEKYINIQY